MALHLVHDAAAPPPPPTQPPLDAGPLDALAPDREQRATFALWFVTRVEIDPLACALASDLWFDHAVWASRVGGRALGPGAFRLCLDALLHPAPHLSSKVVVGLCKRPGLS